VELEAASRLRHPGVARVYALGREQAGGLYVVQEFVPGQSLRAHLQASEKPELKMVIQTVERIASSLECLHEAGVLHRDLKPENVLLRPDRTPVLVDFGV